MRNAIDLMESYDGDLSLQGGDLADTSRNTSLTYKQIIRWALQSKKEECIFYPSMGMNLDSFHGKPNTEKTGMELAKYAQFSLAQSTLLYLSELDITPFPFGKQSIGLQIKIRTLPKDGKLLVVYDTRDNLSRSIIGGSGSMSSTLNSNG